MVAFIPARDLKHAYRVSGHFYSLTVSGVDPLKCRSVLEITSTAGPFDERADAIFVMMNPGSSRPIADAAHHDVAPDQMSAMASRLVPTVPDTTQYQLMRLMHYSGWSHVRVVNLSDIRDAQSPSFTERYMRLEQQSGCDVHSVFSPVRTAELKRHLVRKPSGPIVCAWGVSDRLNPLIQRATSALRPEGGGIGLEAPGRQGKYFHPLPTLQRDKEAWVVQMLKRLRALGDS